jgi:hypothetical protein
MSLYYDRELGNSDNELFDAHLIECLSCRRHLEKIKKTSSLVSEIPELAPIMEEPELIYIVKYDNESKDDGWQKVLKNCFSPGFNWRGVLVGGLIFVVSVFGLTLSKHQDTNLLSQLRLLKSSPTPTASIASNSNGANCKLTSKISKKLSLYNVVVAKSRYQIAVKGEGVQVISVKAWEHPGKNIKDARGGNPVQ